MVDEKDRIIISMLKENSRVSYSEIARKLGISEVAVMKRIKKLESNGVIKKYTVIVDYKKLGYNMVSITGLDALPEYLFSVIEQLKKKDYVEFLAITSGDHSIMVKIIAQDNDELTRIHREIESMQGVHHVRPAIILNVIKE
ncbi:MAG: Lrp/AsnC family transcriptional regulator [Desulfurococcales archaeon]|nr:Lrp/AsnC family transcriptional regulator [Desulfurococcales archaeon]